VSGHGRDGGRLPRRASRSGAPTSMIVLKPTPPCSSTLLLVVWCHIAITPLIRRTDAIPLLARSFRRACYSTTDPSTAAPERKDAAKAQFASS
jgi:hypothetical protein